MSKNVITKLHYMYQYRIMEFDGKFMIQAGREETKGVLWWKHKEMKWSRTDINGQPLLYLPEIRIDTAMLIGKEPLHNSLLSAESKIKSWQKGKQYHYMQTV